MSNLALFIRSHFEVIFESGIIVRAPGDDNGADENEDYFRIRRYRSRPR